VREENGESKLDSSTGKNLRRMDVVLEKVFGWKCDECGKRHFHDRDKHQVSGQILNELEMNPRCHCGRREVRDLLIQGKLRLRAYGQTGENKGT